MNLRWRTVAELQAAKKVIIEAMPGFDAPAAYAVGCQAADGQIDFRASNHRGSHDLPAVVLAKICGYRTGSASYQLNLPTFRQGNPRIGTGWGLRCL